MRFQTLKESIQGLRVEVLIDAGEEGLLNGAADVAYFGYRPAKEGITWIPADTTLRFSWLHAATSVGTDLRKASKNFGTIRSC